MPICYRIPKHSGAVLDVLESSLKILPEGDFLRKTSECLEKEVKILKSGLIF
jgi:hypothetical protein